jgi:hypothetical protein
LKANTIEMVLFAKANLDNAVGTDRSFLSSYPANAIQLYLPTRRNSFHQNTDQSAIQLCTAIDNVRRRLFNASLCGKVCQMHVKKCTTINRNFFHKKLFTYVALFKIKFYLNAVMFSNVYTVLLNQCKKPLLLFSPALQPSVGYGLLVREVS